MRKQIESNLKMMGVRYGISNNYGKNTVYIFAQQTNNPYFIYTCLSKEQQFWGITENVINQMVKDGKDFAVAFLDEVNQEVYIWDNQTTLNELKNASTDAKGNYKITNNDLHNPVSVTNFCEFLESLE